MYALEELVVVFGYVGIPWCLEMRTALNQHAILAKRTLISYFHTGLAPYYHSQFDKKKFSIHIGSTYIKKWIFYTCLI